MSDPTDKRVPYIATPRTVPPSRNDGAPILGVLIDKTKGASMPDAKDTTSAPIEDRLRTLQEEIDSLERDNERLSDELAGAELKIEKLEKLATDSPVCSICGERRQALDLDPLGDFCDECATNALLYYRVWKLRQRLADAGADVGTVYGGAYKGGDR